VRPRELASGGEAGDEQVDRAVADERLAGDVELAANMPATTTSPSVVTTMLLVSACWSLVSWTIHSSASSGPDVVVVDVLVEVEVGSAAVEVGVASVVEPLVVEPVVASVSVSSGVWGSPGQATSGRMKASRAG
jgi:hypothetical protein